MNDPRPTGYDVRLHYDVEIELAARLRSAATPDDRRRLYREVYDERIRRVPGHPLDESGRSPEVRAKQIGAQLRLLEGLDLLTPDTRFLEVGPGDCLLAYAVARRVQHVVAVDVSDVLRPAGGSPDNVDFRLSDGVSMPVEASSIDVGYSNQVLEHLHSDDVEDHLRNVRRALAPGGFFVCITPNRLSGPWDVSRHFDRVPTGLHLREYTVTEVVELLRRAGFSDVSCVVSVGGRRLTPLFAAAFVAPIERMLERFPAPARRRLGRVFAAVKVVARNGRTGDAAPIGGSAERRNERVFETDSGSQTSRRQLG